MSPFNFSKDKTLANLHAVSLHYLLVLHVLNYWELTYSYRGLSVFVCCSVSLRYLAFVSLLLLSMMLCRQLSPRPFAASQGSDPQINIVSV